MSIATIVIASQRVVLMMSDEEDNLLFDDDNELAALDKVLGISIKGIITCLIKTKSTNRI